MGKLHLFIAVLFVVSTSFAEKDKEPEMQVTGEKIDREGIRKTFLEHQKQLVECYNKSLKQAKAKSKESGKEMQNMSGKITLDFTIEEDGSIMYVQQDSARTTLNHLGVAGCIAKQVYAWTFPKPPKGQTVQVFYPLAFSEK